MQVSHQDAYLASRPAGLLYPGRRTLSELQAALRGLDRDSAILWWARLNLERHFSRNEDSKAFDDRYAGQFYSPDQLRTMRKALKRIGKPRTNYLSMFDRRTLLELIRWSALMSLPGGGEAHFADVGARHRLVVAALCAQDLAWNHMLSEHIEPYADLPEPDEALRSFALPIYGTIDELRDHFMGARYLIGRARLLTGEEFFGETGDDRLRFETFAGLTVEAFHAGMRLLLDRVADSFASCARNGSECLSGLSFEEHIPNEMRATVDACLNLSSQPIDGLGAKFGKRATTAGSEGYVPFDSSVLRLRPLLRTADGDLCVSDYAFLLDTIWIGPIFHLLALGENAVALFGRFGAAFERYTLRLLTSIVERQPANDRERLAASPQGVAAGSGGNNTVEIADVWVRKGDALLTIEVKSAWLPEAVRWFHADRLYESTLSKRFGAGGDSVKGVAQLARWIAVLADGSLVPADAESFAGVRRIYPLLIAQDPAIDAPAHSSFLAGEFSQQLERSWGAAMTKEREFYSVGKLRVARVTVLTIAQIEFIEGAADALGLIGLVSKLCEIDPDAQLPASWLTQDGFRLLDRTSGPSAASLLGRALGA